MNIEKKISVQKNNDFFLDRIKIHRRYVPKLSCRIPRGIASRLVARMSNHNWHHNYDLINLRRSLGMRIHARSELCETLTVLSSVLIVYCNYNLYSDYLFEIRAPFEIISHSMNMLHVYDNGRKSYDPPLHALHVLEKLKYIIVFRDRNPDTGQYKPLRIWLTKKFFTSRGITLDELRYSLNKYEDWIVKNNLTSNLLYFNKKHLFKMRVIGIDLLKFPSLRFLLIKIKKDILGKKILSKVNNNIKLFPLFKNKKIFLKNKNRYLKVNNYLYGKGNSVFLNKVKQSDFWYSKFINWSCTKMPHQIFFLEECFDKEFSELKFTDSEKYYRLLLEKGKKYI